MRMLSVAATILTVGALASRARANTTEDMLGVSARASALGGAGTALPNDFTATYYNPALLSECREQMVGVDLRHVYYHLKVTRDPSSTEGSPMSTPNYTRLTVGLCVRLPLDLSLGAMLGLGVHELMTLQQGSPDNRPRFPLWGQTDEQLTLLIGNAWRPKPWLSIGVGAAIFLNAYFPFSLEVPIATEDPANPSQLAPLSLDLNVHMHPKLAPFAGVLVSPTPHVRIGASYRDPLFVEFRLPATVDAKITGLDLLIPILVESIGWYSPRQVALGASGEPASNLTVTGDVTWYNYRALRATPYPFLSVTPTDNGDGITNQIGFPTVDHVAWKNAWALRAGAELRLVDDKLALRAGYALRTSALGSPDPSNVDLLDGTTHSLTLGAGYAPRGREHPSGSTLRATASFDAYVRASVVPEQHATAKQFSYGGNLVDVGVMATLGW